MKRVLVAGIGNVFFGDDGFGVAVANRMAGGPSPEGVRIAEYGIRGVHLAYELLDGYDTLVMIDAVPMGEAPGTLAVIQPDPPHRSQVVEEDRRAPTPPMDSHTMTPEAVLGVLAGLGGSLGEVYIVGCQPATLAPGMELSSAVAAAIERAADLVTELLTDICCGSPRAEERA